MTAIAMIAELAHAGIHLSRRGDRLHVEAKPGSVTPAIRERLAAHKSDLLACLESTSAIRIRLLTIVAAEGIDPAHVHAQDDDDIAECRGLNDNTLRDWMRLRASCAVCCGTHHKERDHD